MFLLPGSSIPKWFEHRSRQDSISFWFRNKLPTISLCVATMPNIYLHIRFELIINGKKYSSSNAYRTIVPDHIIIMDREMINPEYEVYEVLLENEWNHVVCRVTTNDILWPGVTKDYGQQRWLKKFGIHVLKHKSDMEDIRITDPLLRKKEMQRQKNLASLALLKMRQEKWLSLHLPSTMNLSNNVNWDSNSITQMQISSSTNVQGNLHLALSFPICFQCY